MTYPMAVFLWLLMVFCLALLPGGWMRRSK